MSRCAEAIINLEALHHNLNHVKALAPHAKIIAMVKANAYGHGLINIAQALTGADALGVARLHEARELRKAQVTTPIILMEGFFSQDELPEIATLNLGIVIHSDYQITALEKNAHVSIPYVWLKINTGMNRLGFPADKTNALYEKLKSLKNIQEVRGVMTHFSAAEEADKSFTQHQIELFNQATETLLIAKSLANSAGIIAWPEAHADWVRPGLMLYGVSPFGDKLAETLNLKPVMTLKSKLIAINHCHQGDKIGYNCTYTCTEDTLVGVVALGYGDGYPRYIQERMPILVNNIETEVIGRVSMDMLTVNLNPISNAKIGDEVICWGEGLPIEYIAQAAHTSVYELLAGLTPRIYYQYD